MAERYEYGDEWRDEQSSTAYPFADEAVLVSDLGAVVDPDLFLDAAVYIPGATTPAYLNSVSVAADSVVVTWKSGTDTAVGEFDPQAPPDEIRLLDVYGRAAGIIVSDSARLARFRGWRVGTHTFGPKAALVPSVCLPAPEPGLRGFLLPDGEVLSGDVWLVGEAGVTLRYTAGEIRVDLVGDPLFRRAECEDAGLFSTPRFIRTLAGVSPGSTGDFLLTVTTTEAEKPTLRVRPADDGSSLVIEIVGRSL